MKKQTQAEAERLRSRRSAGATYSRAKSQTRESGGASITAESLRLRFGRTLSEPELVRARIQISLEKIAQAIADDEGVEVLAKLGSLQVRLSRALDALGGPVNQVTHSPGKTERAQAIANMSDQELTRHLLEMAFEEETKRAGAQDRAGSAAEPEKPT